MSTASNASESVVSNTGDCSGESPGEGGWGDSPSACEPTSGTRVEHAESGVDGRSSGGSWKETRRALGTVGESRSDTPSTGICGPTPPEGAGAGGSGRVDCGEYSPIMMIGRGVFVRGITSGDVGGDCAIGLRRGEETRVGRGRPVDEVVDVVLIASGCSERGRRDSSGGGGGAYDVDAARAAFWARSFGFAAPRLRKPKKRERENEKRVWNMINYVRCRMRWPAPDGIVKGRIG